MDPSTLIQSRCAGGIRSINRERTRTVIVSIAFAESVIEQSESQTAFAPMREHADLAEPTNRVLLASLELAQDHSRNLTTAIHRQEPERGVEALLFDTAVKPVFKGVIQIAFVDLKSFGESFIGGPPVLSRDKRMYLNAFRPGGCGRSFLQSDLHMPPVPFG